MDGTREKLFLKKKSGTIPRRQVDHGITVFHCQPWLTMVGHAMTMVSDHGPLWPLTMVHGQPWSGYIIVDIERPCFD